MEYIFVFLSLPLLVIGCNGLTSNIEWTEWKEIHFKKYGAAKEEMEAAAIWKKNSALIEKHNLEARAGRHTFTMAMNHLGDKTIRDIKRATNFTPPQTAKSSNHSCSHNTQRLGLQDLPHSVDWRHTGCVTEVVEQDLCLLPWILTATDSLEGRKCIISGGKLISVSKQQLIDCVEPGTTGCIDEYSAAFAFQYTKDYGLESEECYPYTGKHEDCRYNKSCVVLTISGICDVPSTDELALQKAVATVGPIPVGIDASKSSFQFYSSGVYNDPTCSQSQLDHLALVVGYGTDPIGGDYWLVKNSWGPEWGDKGYILMARNQNNQCGIATAACYPVM